MTDRRLYSVPEAPAAMHSLWFSPDSAADGGAGSLLER